MPWTSKNWHDAYRTGSKLHRCLRFFCLTVLALACLLWLALMLCRMMNLLEKRHPKLCRRRRNRSETTPKEVQGRVQQRSNQSNQLPNPKLVPKLWSVPLVPQARQTKANRSNAPRRRGRLRRMLLLQWIESLFAKAFTNAMEFGAWNWTRKKLSAWLASKMFFKDTCWFEALIPLPIHVKEHRMWGWWFPVASSSGETAWADFRSWLGRNRSPLAENQNNVNIIQSWCHASCWFPLVWPVFQAPIEPKTTGQEAVKQELLRTKGDVAAGKTLYVSWLVETLCFEKNQIIQTLPSLHVRSDSVHVDLIISDEYIHIWTEKTSQSSNPMFV